MTLTLPPSKSGNAKTATRKRRRLVLRSFSAVLLLLSSVIASLLWLSDLHNVQCDSRTELVDLKSFLTLDAVNCLPGIWSYGHYLAVAGVIMQSLVIFLHRKTRLSLDYTCLLFWTAAGLLHFIDYQDRLSINLCLTKEDLYTLQFVGSTCLILLIFSVSLLPRKRSRLCIRRRLLNKNKNGFRNGSVFSNNASSMSYNSSDFSSSFSPSDRFFDKNNKSIDNDNRIIPDFDKNGHVTPKINTPIAADKKITPPNSVSPPVRTKNHVIGGGGGGLDSKLSLLSLGGVDVANRKALDSMSIWSSSRYSPAKSAKISDDTSSIFPQKFGGGSILAPSKFTNVKAWNTSATTSPFFSPVSSNSHGGLFSNQYSNTNNAYPIDPWLRKSAPFDALSCYSTACNESIKSGYQPFGSCYQFPIASEYPTSHNGYIPGYRGTTLSENGVGYRGALKRQQQNDDDAISVMSGISNRSFRRMSPKILGKKSSNNFNSSSKNRSKLMKSEFLCKLAVGLVLFISLATNLTVLYCIFGGNDKRVSA